MNSLLPRIAHAPFPHPSVIAVVACAVTLGCSTGPQTSTSGGSFTGDAQTDAFGLPDTGTPVDVVEEIVEDVSPADTGTVDAGPVDTGPVDISVADVPAAPDVPKCSCDGIECGQPPGCAINCSPCKSGLTCIDNQCIDDKCGCNPLQCGFLLGCPETCGDCGEGLLCQQNGCIEDPCDCKNVQCGFQEGCAKNCGICDAFEVCKKNDCVAETPAGMKQLGEYCGPNKLCQPPPPGATEKAQKAFLTCLDNQCIEGFCHDNFCTRECKLTADNVNNLTGAAGMDGVEDDLVGSQCANASDGPNGPKWRCIERASPFQISEGATFALCMPGTDFKPCQNDAQCEIDQACRIYVILGEYVQRCGPLVHNPDGSPGAIGTGACNLNSKDGSLKLCQGNLCTTQGCVNLCTTDDSCIAAPGACKEGLCKENGGFCVGDQDCPKWSCTANVQLFSATTQTFSVCNPKP